MIFQKKICFLSSYNDTVLYGETMVKIMIQELIKIELKDDKLILETEDNKYEFTPFAQREEAFRKIKMLR